MQNNSSISLIILTYNEEKQILRCIESSKDICADIFIIDSFSSYNTIKIAESLGAKVFQHKWDNNHAKQFNPNINFNCVDLITYLKNSDNKYDLITDYDVIEHLDKEELLTTLKLVYNSLYENGQFIIQTPNAESPWFGSVAFGDFTHEWFYTASSLEDVLLKSGFRNIQFKPSEPLFISFKSSIRSLTWKIINMFLKVWNLAETGSTGSKIYTRVFLARAVK